MSFFLNRFKKSNFDSTCIKFYLLLTYTNFSLFICLPVSALHRDAVLQCTFSRDGKALASVSADKTGRLYKIRPGAGEFVPGTEVKELEGHKAAVNAVQFAADNSVLVTGSDDSTIRVWDRSNGNCVTTIKCGGPVRRLCFSPFDGNRGGRVHLACVSANQIEVWTTDEYEKKYQLDFPEENRLTVRENAFSIMTGFIELREISPESPSLVLAAVSVVHAVEAEHPL